MKFMTVAFLFVALVITPSFAYNVLCVFPAPSKSHNFLAKGVVDSLLQAGYKVTWLTTFPGEKIENLEYIDLSEALAIMKDVDMAKIDAIEFAMRVGKNISVMAAENKQLRDVLVKEKFDAVVTEYFFSALPAGFAAVQQVPWIMLDSITMIPTFEYLVDEVRSVSTNPFIVSDTSIPMNYWERLKNTALTAMILFQSWKLRSDDSNLYEALYSPLAEDCGVSLQPLSSAMYNVSIVLLNSHSSITPAFELPPNVIEVAGYHIDEVTPPLPKDLQELLDSSTDGVVYFSMGSLLQSSNMPEETKQGLIKVLGELPYTVLWKFEEKIEGLPKNVHIRAWFPQPSVLAHRNVKLFITHCGLLSSLEALHHGVPLLAVPVYGDQPTNAARAVKAGYALSVPYEKNVAPKLRDALNKILSDDRYYNKAKYLSKLFRNRPVSPKKLIAHYIEVAIESKGAYHLRSNSRFYSWYQRMMLDQLVGVLLVLYLIHYILRKVATKLFGKTSKKENLDNIKSKKTN